MSDATISRSPGRFWWFDGETVRDLCEQLVAAGEGARLECHPVGGQLWLHVVPSDQARVAAFTPLNKSHECPPWCP